jgi:proteasome lid subunit RPN8/RPN11
MKTNVVPVFCVDSLCNRNGIQVFSGAKTCGECGGDLFPIDETMEEEEDPNSSWTTYVEEMMQGKHTTSATPIPHRNGFNPIQNAPAPPQTTFQCPSDLSGCPIASKVTVYVPYDMYKDWVFLAQELDTEWIAYLIGEETSEGKIQIRDMYFPQQKANSTHCEAEDGGILPNTIAAVHSHVGMKVFFSSEDIAHFNHPVELVVNRAGELLANGRVKLECGRYHRGPATVVFTGAEDQISLVGALKQKLKKEAPPFTTSNSPKSVQEILRYEGEGL